MTKYIILFEDNEEYADQRTRFMANHLIFLESHSLEIEAAGPMTSAEDGSSAGGLWLVDVGSESEAKSLVEQDPFWPTGLRKSVKILKWTQVFAAGRRLI